MSCCFCCSRCLTFPLFGAALPHAAVDVCIQREFNSAMHQARVCEGGTSQQSYCHWHLAPQCLDRLEGNCTMPHGAAHVRTHDRCQLILSSCLTDDRGVGTFSVELKYLCYLICAEMRFTSRSAFVCAPTLNHSKAVLPSSSIAAQ